MVNVAIQTGWAEGDWHTKQFADALKAAGFNVTAPQHADYLFAHSTACYDLPLKSPITGFILIDPPYWPGKPLWKRIVDKKVQDTKLNWQAWGWQYVLAKTWWELVYAVTKAQYLPLALKNQHSVDFLNALGDKKAMVIRNQNDTFCSPEIQVALTAYTNVLYLTLPGTHDDYLTNPKPYIDLLLGAL